MLALANSSLLPLQIRKTAGYSLPRKVIMLDRSIAASAWGFIL